MVMIGGVTGQLLITTAYTAVTTLELLIWRMMLIHRELLHEPAPAYITQPSKPVIEVGSPEEVVGD